MEARVKLLGHPVHQMLIVLPLGLLTGAVIFDIVRWVTRDNQFAATAYWLIPAGVIGGLIAAGFGLVDWMKIPDGTRAKRIGRLHAIANTSAIILFVASWLLRGSPLDPPSGFALLLSFVGLAVVTLGGWLGGELVDRLGVGVDDGANLDAPSSLSGQPADRGTPRHPRAA